MIGTTKSQLCQMVDLANMIPKLYSNDEVLLIVKFDPKCKRKQTNQTNSQSKLENLVGVQLIHNVYVQRTI